MADIQPTESSFNIELKGSILLKITFNSEVPIDSYHIQDASTRLDALIDDLSLVGGSFLAIKSPCSAQVGYLIATKLGHLYGAIAVESPNLAENGNSRYIVAISNSFDYQVGDIVELDDGKVNRVIQTDTYSIKFKKDVLEVDFSRVKPINNNLFVRYVSERIDEISSKILDTRERLEIKGIASLPICYAIAYRVSYLFNEVAIFDPTIGEEGEYVIIKTNPPEQTSFLIQLTNNPLLLCAKINTNVHVNNDQLVLTASDRLDQLINAHCLSGGDFLAVTGSCSLPVAHLIATKLRHLYSAIAVFDIRLTRKAKGKERYVVTISNSPKYHIGDIVSLEDDATKIISHITDCEELTDTFFVKLKRIFVKSKEDNFIKFNQDVFVKTKENEFVKSEENIFVKLDKDIFIELDQDLLLVDFNQLEPADNNLIVRDACKRIDKLISDNTMKGGELLKINGPASLIVSYAISDKVSDLYKAIAVFEPKMDKYIVTKSETSKYSLGETLPFEPDVNYPRMRIVLCGPPNTGKTCLRGGLKEAISSLNAGIYPYFITAHPDGEACYTEEINHIDPSAGELYKIASRSKFSDDFVGKIAGWVRNVNQPLALIDVGGQITIQNGKIMGDATHAIILYRDDTLEEKARLSEWVDFCEGKIMGYTHMRLKIIAKICSDANANKDSYTIDPQRSLLEGRIHGIAKNVNISERETVKALAKLIVEMVQENMKQVEVPS